MKRAAFKDLIMESGFEYNLIRYAQRGGVPKKNRVESGMAVRAWLRQRP